MRCAVPMVALAITVSVHAAETVQAAAAVDTSATAPLDPVFDCFHVSTAWGFALSGTMIDRQGNIYRYRMHGKGWAPPSTQVDGATYYRDATCARSLLTQKAMAASMPGPLAEMPPENAALIVKSADGEIQRADTGTRDAGSSTCHAYMYEPTQQRYRDVELGSDGGASDMRDSNSSADAQTLLEWLKSVDVASQ